ncbi:MAG: hypothetical protein PHV74_09500, partial [Dehalococcoidia bacterium]|nr:hypothetical protein [Dehalococcoidia bacterium]
MMSEISAKKTDVSKIVWGRIRKIRSELISSCFGLHDEETFLFSFFDHIHLLLQPTQESPLAFSVWSKDCCIYSTFRDLYYTASPYALHQADLSRPSHGIRILENEDYWICLHRVNTKGLKDIEEARQMGKCFPQPMNIQETFLPIADKEYLKQTFLLLRSSEEDLGSRLDEIPRYKELLLGSLRMSSRLDYPTSQFWPEIPVLNYQEQMMPLLGTFREVLDEVFREMNVSLFENHQPRLGNIFCVVRTIQSNSQRDGRFPYTAGLLLSSQQREMFSEWCKGGCDKTKCRLGLTPNENCLDYFEVPLGEQSRSAADVTFCSGIIDFGREAGDGVWDRVNQEDQLERGRQSVERCVYPNEQQTVSPSQVQAEGPSLYYIPVHVNGIPWIVLFTFTPSPSSEQKEQIRWEHNFTFYRKATQKALSYLRWRAEEAYLSEIVSSAFGQGVSWQLPPSEIQHRVN